MFLGIYDSALSQYTPRLLFCLTHFLIHVCVGVYDDEDLAEDGLFLLVCPQAPHYLWVGSQFHHLHEILKLDQGSGQGKGLRSGLEHDAELRTINTNNSVIPFSSNLRTGQKETSDSGQGLGVRGGGEEEEEEEEEDRISDLAVVSWTCRHVLRGRPSHTLLIYLHSHALSTYL